MDLLGWKTGIVSGRKWTYLSIQSKIACSAEKESLGIPNLCPQIGPHKNARLVIVGRSTSGTNDRM